MGLPVTYNVRSVAARWVSSLVAILGIAGAVGVFIAMLALARGFQATLVSSGSPMNAIIRQAGADSELTSSIDAEAVAVVSDLPQVARRGSQPLVSPEVVFVASLPLKEGGGEANVEVRGVAPGVLAVRDNVRIVAGRFFTPGLYEVIVGRNARLSYAHAELGDRLHIGPGTWTVVGQFDAGGSAFDSEIWGDANVLNASYQRPPGIFGAVTARLTSEGALTSLQNALAHNPRVHVDATRETDYYAGQSRMFTTLITALGGMVAAVMGLGAVLAALNTMYAAISERGREIAVLRAIGFGGMAIVLSFLIESLLIAAIGGLVGCVAVLPINGITTGTMNWQTFAHLSFAFRVTSDLMLLGFIFALAMGVLGGLPPAIRAARGQISTTLRGL